MNFMDSLKKNARYQRIIRQLEKPMHETTDIDSTSYNAFDLVDTENLEKIVSLAFYNQS